jgi:hypothetical protein
MSAVGDGLGRVFNVIHQASGLDIPLTGAGAVSFVSFLDAGTQTLTFTQTDSTAVNSEVDLDVFTVSGTKGANGVSNIFAGPGVGGTWTAKTSSDANAFNLTTDATNDCVVITVRADQLTDGYDQVQCTAGSGTCIAIIHDLKVQRRATNLKSSLTA